MKLNEAIAIYERCQSQGLAKASHDPCPQCVLSRIIGDPEDHDAFGVAYTIYPCIFLSELEWVVKDTPAPVPEVSQGG